MLNVFLGTVIADPSTTCFQDGKKCEVVDGNLHVRGDYLAELLPPLQGRVELCCIQLLRPNKRLLPSQRLPSLLSL